MNNRDLTYDKSNISCKNYEILFLKKPRFTSHTIAHEGTVACQPPSHPSLPSPPLEPHTTAPSNL